MTPIRNNINSEQPPAKRLRLNDEGDSTKIVPLSLFTDTVSSQPLSTSNPSSTDLKRKREDDEATVMANIKAPMPTKVPVIPPAPFASIVDTVCQQVVDNIFTTPQFSCQEAFKVLSAHQPLILKIWEEITAKFFELHPQPFFLQFKDRVPNYFANVIDKSLMERKYLSLIGMWNMIHIGPSIVDDFHNQFFIGGRQHYSPKNGLNAFKFFTGTQVDLDTEIAATTPQEAIALAKPLIVNFGKLYGLTGTNGEELTAEEVARQMPRRKLELPQAGMPIYYTDRHDDRSNYGIWTRGNHEIDKIVYYVNVPNCDLVLSATLRLPYMVAELFWKVKAKNNGIVPENFMREFIEHGLSDKCFNEKFRVFYQFYLDWLPRLDGVITAEDIARTKLTSGAFGPYLQNLNPEIVFQQKATRPSLIALFEKHEFTVEGLTTEEFAMIETDRCIEILKEANAWEKVLYQTEPGQDYFLLNQNTLQLFLREYLYTYVKSLSN